MKRLFPPRKTATILLTFFFAISFFSAAEEAAIQEAPPPFLYPRPLSTEDPDYKTTAYIQYGAFAGPRVALLAGAHGDEPAAVAALEEFMETARVRRGVILYVPRQNPLALKNETRTSRWPENSNFYNFARAYPVGTLTDENQGVLEESLHGYLSYNYWWLAGDDILYRRGIIPRHIRYPGGVHPFTNWLDEEGYRRALAPRIRNAGKRVFLLLKEFQPDYVADMHESFFSYRSSLCIDDPESLKEVERILPHINQTMESEDLPPLVIHYVPTPTSLPWATAYGLEKPAKGFTLESDARLSWDERVAQHRVMIWSLLREWGMEPYLIRTEPVK